MAPIMYVSWSPNWSSFCLRGVSSSSSAAAWICAWILPISVRMPVSMTTATHAPCDTDVPPKRTHSLPWSSHPASDTGSVVLLTATDSPVSDACSSRMVAVLRRTTRQSAGTRSPVRTSTTSPGTSSRAGRSLTHSPARRHRAVSLCISLSASSALSALLSCHTPTMAFNTRISKMTPGSTKSTRESSTPGARSSVNARTNETSAATRRILTSASSNCSNTSFHSGLPSSLSSSLNPNVDRRDSTFVSLRPVCGSTSSLAQTSGADAVHGVYGPSPAPRFFDGVLRGGIV
mmetsp:Transcript_9161/g.25531  ORF Transcript_9161/g.25531 Transcript_9161/m.25531 type:complete len:290 (+) Transcript_9161:2484-3353(+)